ncbi:hypothetical protein HII36_34245 [Nonomuraea sp. NN258]|uniref:hypothetical protein n=1 Tax=Nonomuraea antri TaxID=2730852 RepID=UPI0015699B7F|nr:hypothetical protein [Nonomuraea antri]NRQ36864.1 hypothetical protein [Nonomuraea antri]
MLALATAAGVGIGVASPASAVGVAAPASASAPVPASQVATAASAPAAIGAPYMGAAAGQLIRTKVYFGRCEDTCRIKVRITNRSRKLLFNVKMTARLKINGKRVGTCTDYVGSIRGKRVRWAGCTVRSRTLARLWDRHMDNEIDFDAYVNTTVYYRYW